MYVAVTEEQVPVDEQAFAPLAPDPAQTAAVPAHIRILGRLVPRSLRARLVVGVVGLVILLVLATGIGTYVALRSFLYDRLDQQLQQTATEAGIARVFGSSDRPLGPPGLRAPTDVWAVALTTTGDVLAYPDQNTAVDSMTLSSTARTQLATRVSTRPLSITTTDGQNLRVVTRHVTVQGLPQGPVSFTAVIGLSTAESQRTLHRLLLLELAIGASAVVLAFGATEYGVRFSLRRLRRVTDTAREVTAELSPEGAGLDRRVPVTPNDEGTEVGQLAESMNTLLGAVEEQFAARLENEQRMRQFLADASHELRTPLTSIRGYAELSRMQHGLGQATDPETLARIEFEGNRMSRLVEDLLTLAREDGGASSERVPTDLGELCTAAVDGARASYPDRQIDLVLANDLLVDGDPDQLLRVVRNLVTNACVHTAPGGPVRVSARADAHWAVIEVADSGPGLTPEQVSHVFERFWRADSSRARSSGGSGLGMSIVYSIVSAHGGRIAFASDVAAGSTVTVWLQR